MPRIIDSSSGPLDFCRRHMPSEAVAIKRYGNVGDGPDGRGNCFSYNDDHPDYEDWDAYVCETCGRKLTAKDD